MRRESFQNPVTISIRIEKIERDMAQYAGINVSEVCRRAIRQELGLCLKESPSIPKSMVDQYFLYLDTRMKQDAELLETVRDYVFQKTQAEEQVTERQQQISAAIKASVDGTADYYVRRLPEHDPRGDFLEVWDDLQKVIQAAHGIQVSHDELYEYFRRLKA
jgi:hypothetical protein